jgi:hypothetical protein
MPDNVMTLGPESVESLCGAGGEGRSLSARMWSVSYRFHNAEHAIFATLARIHCPILPDGTNSESLVGTKKSGWSEAIILIENECGSQHIKQYDLILFEVKILSLARIRSV